MIATRYSRAQKWIATATFPHPDNVNVNKYNEYAYEGFGETPEEAITHLMRRLEANPHSYYYTYWHAERLTRYSPHVRYNHHDHGWFCEMEFERPNAEVDSILGEGVTPSDAFTDATRGIALRGVHIPRNQSRTAKDLFTV